MKAEDALGAALVWLEAKQELLFETVAECIRIPSVGGVPQPDAPLGAEVKRALDFVLQWGLEQGFRAQDFSGYAVEFEWGEGEEVVGVLGHVDVVPAGDGWSVPPFSGVRRDGRIWGRGAADDKGPIFAAAFAAAALKESGFLPGRKLRFIIGGDEEQEWRCLQHYFSQRPQPDLGFSPDAHFPVIHAEKGILDVALVADASDLLTNFRSMYPQVGDDEPAVFVEMTGEGGERSNMVPDQASLHFEARGRSAHGSMPETGVNAVALLLQQLKFLADDDRFNLLLEAAADTSGAALGVAGSDEVSGALTSNLGRFQMTAGRIEAIFNLRYPVLWREEEVLDRIRNKVEAAGWKVERRGGKPALYVPTDDPFLQVLMQAFRAETGLDVPPQTMGGGTYARALQRGVAFGAILPGRDARFHEPDESIDEQDLLTAARIYLRAFSTLLDASRTFA